MERNNPVLSAVEGNELVVTVRLSSRRSLGQRPRRALGFARGTSGQGLYDADRALLARVEAGFETVGELYNACKFRAVPSALLSAGLG